LVVAAVIVKEDTAIGHDVNHRAAHPRDIRRIALGGIRSVRNRRMTTTRQLTVDYLDRKLRRREAVANVDHGSTAPNRRTDISATRRKNVPRASLSPMG
jgi:hypothetical protein